MVRVAGHLPLAHLERVLLGSEETIRHQILPNEKRHRWDRPHVLDLHVPETENEDTLVSSDFLIQRVNRNQLMGAHFCLLDEIAKRFNTDAQ